MFAIVLALLMLLSACSSAPPTGPEAAKALIEESATAMGGWAVLDAVKSQEIIVGGGDWEPMQAVDPNGEARTMVTPECWSRWTQPERLSASASIQAGMPRVCAMCGAFRSGCSTRQRAR